MDKFRGCKVRYKEGDRDRRSTVFFIYINIDLKQTCEVAHSILLRHKTYVLLVKLGWRRASSATRSRRHLIWFCWQAAVIGNGSRDVKLAVLGTCSGANLGHRDLVVKGPAELVPAKLAGWAPLNRQVLHEVVEYLPREQSEH